VKPFEEYRDGKLNILFVSRLEPRKGLNYLLAAYRQVKQEIPECRLLVVGPGTRLKHRYERDIRNHNIKDVVFTGFATSEELPRYYKTADIFCAPATGRESFGIILLEAMAAGKPIVASYIDGYASVVTDGVEGLLVPPRDSRSLAVGLRKLLTDESLRREMGNRGRTNVLKYSWENVANSVFDYYNQVLAGAVATRKATEI
jgi:phosphatidylinositol alpha-mannosyltransferase